MKFVRCFISLFIPYTFHKIDIHQANKESYVFFNKITKDNHDNLNVIKDISKLVIDTSEHFSINKYIDDEKYISVKYQNRTISVISYNEQPTKITMNNIVFQPNYYKDIQPLMLVIFKYLYNTHKKEINIERLSQFMKLEYALIIDKL